MHRKRTNKPQPVIKGGCIGDPSSSEDEQEPVQKNVFGTVKRAVIIGEDDKQTVKIVNKPEPRIFETKVVIGDDSSDEEDNKKTSKPQKFTPKEISPDYIDKLSKLYNDKKMTHEHIIKSREEHLKKYEEEHKDKDVKCKDSSDEDDDKPENLDKEELWQKFAHQNVQKPVMKNRKRNPQKKKDFSLE